METAGGATDDNGLTPRQRGDGAGSGVERSRQRGDGAGIGVERSRRETWDGADGRRNGAAGNMGRGSGEHGTGRRGRLLEFMVFMTNITEEK